MKIGGSVHRYGDEVDTDLILPGSYLSTGDRKVMASHAMEGLDPDFPRRVSPGDLVVAGRNFGCGSARPAARVLADSGISCIIAGSFARLFLRSAINIGMPVIESQEAVDGTSAGDRLEVDLAEGVIQNLTTGALFRTRPLPPFLQEIVRVGGLVAYARSRFQGAPSSKGSGEG